MLPCAMSVERRNAGSPGPSSDNQRPQHVGGIVVVGVEHEEGRAAGERLRGEDGVGGASGLRLNRKSDTGPLGRVGPLVVVADDVVLGSDDQADVVAAGVGERAQDVVEERPPERDHGFQSRVGDFRLRRVGGGGCDPPVASWCPYLGRGRGPSRGRSEKRIDRADAQDDGVGLPPVAVFLP